MLEKNKAQTEAKALAKSLGKGWKPTVFKKSSGWHCCVVRGPLAVYPMVEGKFICRFTDSPENIENKPTILSSTRLCETPIEAIKETLGTAKIVVHKLSSITKVAEQIMDESIKTSIKMNFLYNPLTDKIEI